MMPMLSVKVLNMNEVGPTTKMIPQRMNTAQRLMLLRFLIRFLRPKATDVVNRIDQTAKTKTSIIKVCSMPSARLMAAASIGVPDPRVVALAPNRPKIKRKSMNLPRKPLTFLSPITPEQAVLNRRPPSLRFQ